MWYKNVLSPFIKRSKKFHSYNLRTHSQVASVLQKAKLGHESEVKVFMKLL